MCDLAAAAWFFERFLNPENKGKHTQIAGNKLWPMPSTLPPFPSKSRELNPIKNLPQLLIYPLGWLPGPVQQWNGVACYERIQSEMSSD